MGLVLGRTQTNPTEMKKQERQDDLVLMFQSYGWPARA